MIDSNHDDNATAEEAYEWDRQAEEQALYEQAFPQKARQAIPLDTLTRPFDASQVKQREGRGGKMLDYLETHAVITRLNDAFNGAWSFEILDTRILDAEVLVRGRLTAHGQHKEQFGGTDIARRKDTKEPVSLSDDLKSAGSDCLKKCATLFGVGLELYAKDAPVPYTARQRREAEAASAVNASSKQVEYIKSLLQSPYIADERPAILEELAEGIDRIRASELIENLKTAISRNRMTAANGNGHA